MSILAGVLVAVIVGYLAMTLLCKDVPAAAPQDSTRSAAAASVAAAPIASDSVSPAVGTVPAGDAGIGAARKASAPVEPVKETPAPVADTAAVEAAPEQVAEAEVSEEEPAGTSEEAVPTAPVADTAAVEAAPEQVVEAEEAPAVVTTPEKTVETAPEGPTSGGSTDGKPALLDAPRTGGADDLKRIGGIGPKLEQTLNELGIFHFDQIAALQGEEIDWVDSRLRFKGRIRRDDWIGQAKALASDGKAEG
jgi:predicted flap endonuclease-1-like 5' DNA nuclease